MKSSKRRQKVEVQLIGMYTRREYVLRKTLELRQ